MATRAEISKLAKEMWAKVDYSYNRPLDLHELQVQAPDGKIWEASGGHHLVCVWYGYDPGDKEDSLADLLSRMGSGYEDDPDFEP